MIVGIEILGYKALRYVNVDVDRFQVLVGPNASGKTTFFDVVGFVGDILNFGLERAVFGDSRFNVVQRGSDPADLTWLRQGDPVQIVLTLRLPDSIVAKLPGRQPFARYELAIEANDILEISNEAFFLCRSLGEPSEQQRTLFPLPEPPPRSIVLASGKKTPAGRRKVVNKVVNRREGTWNDYFRAETSDWNNLFRLGPAKSALANLPEDEDKFPAATWVKRFLMEGTHRLMLNADAMRRPSPAGSPKAFLPDGSNLPWVVHDLEEYDTGRLEDWIAHLQTAIEDIDSVRTREREEDRARYIEVTYRSGLRAPSWLLSDGTLRMFALTLLAYTRAEARVVLIEEPENGIHPKAIDSVIQSLSSVYDAQVFCATHSPLVLSMVEARQLLCFAKDGKGAVDVVRGDAHPGLQRWRSNLHLGDLFAAGILG